MIAGIGPCLPKKSNSYVNFTALKVGKINVKPRTGKNVDTIERPQKVGFWKNIKNVISELFPKLDPEYMLLLKKAADSGKGFNGDIISI